MYEVSRDLLARNGLTVDDVGDHDSAPGQQAHHHRRRRSPRHAREKVLINIDRYGNTTAGTIPLATRDAIAQGRLKKGDLVLFAAVGAGYTVGASLWRWAF